MWHSSEVTCITMALPKDQKTINNSLRKHTPYVARGGEFLAEWRKVGFLGVVDCSK
jgi:hypothetical protein